MSLQNAACHQFHDIQLPHWTVRDSHVGISGVLVSIACCDILADETCIELPYVCNRILPQSDNQCKYLVLLIYYSNRLVITAWFTAVRLKPVLPTMGAIINSEEFVNLGI